MVASYSPVLVSPVGAVIFGILSDRYAYPSTYPLAAVTDRLPLLPSFGRKWPLIFNMWCITALQIGTSFVHDFKSFLAVRSIFGIFMGGMYLVSVILRCSDELLQACGVWQLRRRWRTFPSSYVVSEVGSCNRATLSDTCENSSCANYAAC